MLIQYSIELGQSFNNPRLPGANGVRERLGVSGWRLGQEATGAPLPTCPLSISGRADRPRSAAGMGSGFVSRSDDVPDLMPVSRERGPAGTLVPTWRERGSRAVGGWRLAGGPKRLQVSLESSGPPVLVPPVLTVSPQGLGIFPPLESSCPRVLHSSPLAHVPACPRAPSASQVGLTVCGRPRDRPSATGSGTSSLREMKPDPMPWPRTSRDAGPYLIGSL